MTILLAGPFVGEFGWELFFWQGFVRKLARQYDKTVVIGRPLNKALYTDFCNEYIPFEPESWDTDAHRCNNSKDPTDLINSIKHTHYMTGKFDVFRLFNIIYTDRLIDPNNIFFNNQEFIKYTSDTDNRGYDVIFHCRNKETGNHRNWSYEKWEELKDMLPKDISIGCIGNSEAFYIDETDDLREIPLDKLISIFNNSKLIVGPSSGPMHLASLCGLKHLVWSNSRNINRYQHDWNPLQTNCIIHTDGMWNPEVEVISNLVQENIL